jgi:5-methylcytosine-specific restriction endonuclease McrA
LSGPLLFERGFMGRNNQGAFKGVNRLCKTCKKDCKQFENTTGVRCPNFTSISKKADNECITKNPYYELVRRHNRRYAGGIKLTTPIIEKLYEQNIKKYGVLTCYLCLKPINLENEHIEHKIPISRNGSNDWENLAISCKTCNLRKNTKTEKEYIEKSVKSNEASNENTTL